MWKCPDCGREFSRTNQGHYCGKAPKTVEEYIESQIPKSRPHIIKLRSIIKLCVPEVTEQIAWSMPTYKKDGISISFAACKKQISFYAGTEALEILGPEISDFTIKKNVLYLPYDKPLPSEIIEKLLKQIFPETNSDL